MQVVLLRYGTSAVSLVNKLQLTYSSFINSPAGRTCKCCSVIKLSLFAPPILLVAHIRCRPYKTGSIPHFCKQERSPSLCQRQWNTPHCPPQPHLKKIITDPRATTWDVSPALLRSSLLSHWRFPVFVVNDKGPSLTEVLYSMLQ